MGDFSDVDATALIGALRDEYPIIPLVFDFVPVENADRRNDNYKQFKTLVDGGFVAALVLMQSFDRQLVEDDVANLEKLNTHLNIFIKDQDYADDLSEDFLTQHRLIELSGGRGQKDEAYKLLGQTVKGWKHPTNFFGVRDARELAQTTEMLSHVGSAVNDATEKSIPVDDNTSTLIQALRMHILGPELRYEDLNWFSRKGQNLEEVASKQRIETRELLDAVQKFRLLEGAERFNVIKELSARLNWELLEDGRRLGLGASRGAYNKAFAYDPITGFNTTSGGFGAHAEAMAKLELYVDTQMCYRKRLSGAAPESQLYDYTIGERAVRGYIVNDVAGFPCPFAMVWGNFYNATDMETARDFIIKTYGAIPVDPDGNLLE